MSPWLWPDELEDWHPTPTCWYIPVPGKNIKQQEILFKLLKHVTTMLNTRSLSKKNTPESYCLKRVPQPRICLCHLNLHDADQCQTEEYASNYYQDLLAYMHSSSQLQLPAMNGSGRHLAILGPHMKQSYTHLSHRWHRWVKDKW
jgi:hypothetical protein